MSKTTSRAEVFAEARPIVQVNDDSHNKMKEVKDKEISERLRRNILDVLDLWSSRDKQLEYQDRVPIAQVSTELFCMWEDMYAPDTNYFNFAFKDRERAILTEFDKLLNHISNKKSNHFPYIKDFVETNDWLALNQAAIDALKKIRDTSANTH